MTRLHYAWLIITSLILSLIITDYGYSEEKFISHADTIAAIRKVENNPDRQALLLTIAIHESGLLTRIANNECLPHECDKGRAWGLWQQWQNSYNSKDWGSKDINVQAKWAARTLRSQWARCYGYPGVQPILAAIRGYAGRGCDTPIRGEMSRLATYNKVRSEF